ncbi:MAG: PBP1A family penicillin-binding protein [Candidatus Falkowbacteria bacterium]
MPIPQLRSQKSWQQDHRPSRPARHNWRDEVKNKKQALVHRFGWKKLIIFGLLGLIALIVVFVAIVSWNLPNPDKLLERQVAQSTKIYDRTCETLLYEVSGDQKRTMVTLDQIPDNVKHATIAIEDKNFYKHAGFSFWAIFRTAVTNILFNRKAGGSTLTQQFVKNAVLTNEKSYIRKLKEIILAYRLEKKFTKDQVLQMYLNEIPYGSNAYGVESASQFYFGKKIKDTDLAEAAVLAALVQQPSRYSPYGPNKDLLITRQHTVLDLMVEQGYINKDQAQQAKNEQIKFQQRIENIQAPHFVMYIKELIADKFGEKEAEQGGYTICTTLDIDKQRIAERVLKEQALKNQASNNASNAALVAMDPKTGEVLAMVGSRDYFDDSIDGQVNVALKPRQPGSSFKPIAYTEAFIKGFFPETMVYDAPTNFSTDPSKSYEPQNYNGQNYGPVSLRQALAGSLNIPAVKTMYLAGIDNVLGLANNLGYTTLGNKDQYGLTLVLGGGEVKLIEHVRAYAALAREGQLPETVFIRKITDAKGNTIEEFKDPVIKEVIDPNIARMTVSIMSDNNARAYVFGAQNYLNLGARPVAAKTGTTNDYRDAWTMGFTPSLVAGVWVGNNDNSKMKAGSDGSVVAAPIWNRFMKEALGNGPIEQFKTYAIPPNTRPILLGIGFANTKIKVDKTSGLLATDLTPPEMTEERTYAQTHDLLYFVDKNNPNGPQPTNPAQDPQYVGWEKGVATWIEAKKKKDPTFLIQEPPKESDNIHVAANKPTFSISGLTDGQTITTPNPEIRINASAPRGVKLVEYYFNDNLFTANANEPFNLNRQLDVLPNGDYKLTIKVCDDIYNCSSADYKITLNIFSSQAKETKFNISWSAPANGSTFSEKNLPLELKVSLLSPENIATIRFYQLIDGKPLLIAAKKIVRSDIESTFWGFDSQNQAGPITIYAEAEGWTGTKLQTSQLTLTYQPEKK